MAGISAKSGTITAGGVEMNNVRNITITETSDNKAYATNDTDGQMNRVAGHLDWSGSLELYAESGTLIVPNSMAAGGAFVLIAKSDGTKNVSGTAIIDSVENNIDVESGDLVSVTINFSGNSVLARADT